MNIHSDIETSGASAPRHYEDFHAWLMSQAAALRATCPQGIDWRNLAEEIEALGNSDERELVSGMRVILEHLLKVQFGAARDPEAGWLQTIRTQRDDLDDLLRLSPSLRGKAAENLDRAYRRARREALAGFREQEPERIDSYEQAIPNECPYRLEDVLSEAFLPGRPD